MDIEQFREHCIAIKGATESTPFLGHNILVFKVFDKMFCMMPLEPKDGIFWADLKCNPEYTLELREKYAGINHGHVKSTLLWHRITLDSDVPDKLIVKLISHSVDEVIKKIPKAKREAYLK
ncbi:MAG: MmcQ/YjbR family DNA-binding protein [Bacteroides sp.]|nr:MmcQ/YjbR family DNA-binding protein [Bacteroides sp.]